MFFRARNGTYKRVGQVPNRFLGGEVGGMTVYYTTPYDGAKSTAFTPVSHFPALSLSLFHIYLLPPSSTSIFCLPLSLSPE